MSTREQAEAELGPYLEKLRKCITYGWDCWEELGKLAPSLKVSLSSRSRASLISDWVLTAVRREFTGIRGVRLQEVRGFPELIVKTRYIIRFKKLDRNGRSRNVLTRAQREWFSGQMSLLPNDIPQEEATRIVAGYVLDLFGTEMARILVTSPVGTSSVAWILDLTKDPGSNVVQLDRGKKAPKPPSVASKQKKTTEQDDDSGA